MSKNVFEHSWNIDWEIKQLSEFDSTQFEDQYSLSKQRCLTMLNTANKIPQIVERTKIKLSPFQRYSLTLLIKDEKTERCGIYSDPLGSGKTFVILALHSLSIPANKFRYEYVFDPQYNKENRQESTIIRRFINIKPTTVIVVTSSTFQQWNATILAFTDYTVLALDKYEDYLNFKTDDKNYDFILVRIYEAHSVNLYRDFPKLIHSTLVSKIRISSFDLFNHITTNKKISWRRIVYDDINLSFFRKSYVPGCFLWFVNSTISAKYDTGNNFENEFLARNTGPTNYHIGIPQIFNDVNLIFKVRKCDENFINIYNRLPTPLIIHIAVRTSNSMFTNLIGNFSGTSSISDALNADDVRAAAVNAGIVAYSVGDIFHSIIGDQYQKFKQANDDLKFINSIQWKFIPIEMICRMDLGGFRRYTQNEFEKRLVPSTADQNTMQFFQKKRAACEKIIKGVKQSFNRIRDSIKYNTCGICDGEFERDIIIIKSCGGIFCSECLFGIIIEDGKDIKKDRFKCVHCREMIDSSHFIYIPSVLDTNNELSPYKNYSNTINIKGTKLEVVHKIMTNQSIEEFVKETNKAEINDDCIFPEPTYIKMLLFTGYTETAYVNLHKFKEFDTLLLGGTSNEVLNISNQYINNKKNTIMVINNVKFCEGLNLQVSSHVVFLHKPNYLCDELQMIGRGQRMGRTSRLQVYYLEY
jgi:hypothetical protein